MYNFVKWLNTIKFNSIPKFIIHFCDVYINPIFTVIFNLSGLGGDACICACVEQMLLLIKCCWVAKYCFAGLPNIRETLLQKQHLTRKCFTQTLWWCDLHCSQQEMFSLFDQACCVVYFFQSIIFFQTCQQKPTFFLKIKK